MLTLIALAIGASLYRDGIVANGIQVVIRYFHVLHYVATCRKWVKERNEIGAVFNDSTTVFAHVNMLADARNTDQCRKHLKLQPHVDMAIICTVTAVNSHAGNGSAVTVWICSDLQETSLKLTIYGSILHRFLGLSVTRPSIDATNSPSRLFCTLTVLWSDHAMRVSSPTPKEY